VGGRLGIPPVGLEIGNAEGPFGVAEPRGGMPAVALLGIGGRTAGIFAVVARFARGASAAFKVTRTVSRFSGTLVVLSEGTCDSAPGIPDLRGGRTAPV